MPKGLRDCKSCGKNIIKYACSLCGTGVCGACYNIETGLCINCHSKKLEKAPNKEFIKLISSKIPIDVKRGKSRFIFGELFSFIKTNKIKSSEELKKRLDEGITACREWLAKYKTGTTINRKRRDYTRKLEYFMGIKDLIDKYL